MESENGNEVYSKAVRAGKRTYFFDVKATKANDLYLTITESKKMMVDGRESFQKHKVFLYKEDFEKFQEGLADAIDKIANLKETDDTYLDEEFTSDATEKISEVNFEDL